MVGVLGSTKVKAEHNGQTAELTLVVTEGTGPSLLGRDWLVALKLNWQEILSVKTTQSLQSVLDHYPEAFKDELGNGEIKGVLVKIHRKGDAHSMWLLGKVKEQQGAVMSSVKLEDGSVVHKHADHL